MYMKHSLLLLLLLFQHAASILSIFQPNVFLRLFSKHLISLFISHVNWYTSQENINTSQLVHTAFSSYPSTWTDPSLLSRMLPLYHTDFFFFRELCQLYFFRIQKRYWAVRKSLWSHSISLHEVLPLQHRMIRTTLSPSLSKAVAIYELQF